MQENFKGYKVELEQVRLTKESKKALAESLSRHKSTEHPVIKSRCLPAGAKRIAAIAAVVCLLVTGAVAAGVASPTLRNQLFGESAGYEQNSVFIGKSVENNGWTVTITDCVADDVDLYMGLEVTAPEGVIPEEGSYQFGKGPGDSDLDLTFPDMEGGRDTLGIVQLPDSDPTDNKLEFMLHSGNMWTEESYNGQKMRLKIYNLCRYYFDVEKQETVYIPACGGVWDFGEMTMDFPDSTIRLEPNVPVTTLDVEATITEVTVSPISVKVRIEGEALKGHHAWVPKDAPDGWYSCIDYQEITLYCEDGSVIPVDSSGLLAGSGCSGGEPGTGDDGWLIIRRAYEKGVNGTITRLMDVDSLTAISVCGVKIPLK